MHLSADLGARGFPRWWPPGAGPGVTSFRSLLSPPQIRRVIYTTNAIESVQAQVCKIIKTRGHFPSGDAASKLIWLALKNITAEWGKKAAKDWKDAMNQFAILYQDRFITPKSA
jgi:transposase-like protein